MNKFLPAMLCAAAVFLTACDRVDPNSPLGKRKAIYQEMLDVKEDMGGMLRGRLPFDATDFAAGAARLDVLAHQPWQYYPEVKEEQSKAREDVWQRQERFKELARELEAATAALVQASTRVPFTAESVQPAFQQVEDTCEGCHEEFRAY